MFKPEDFKDMERCPFACKKGERMWQKYPEMARYKAFTEIPSSLNLEGLYLPQEEDLDLLLKFTALFLERYGNPLSKEKDFERREELAWEMLGVKRVDSTVRSFVAANHRWWRGILFEYFRLVNDDEYNLWCSLKMNFANNMAVLRHQLPVNADEKFVNAINRIKAQSAGDLEQIRTIELKLFGDEKLRQIIHEETAVTSNYAELMAED